MTWQIFSGLWAAAGLAFWISCLNYNGAPGAWRARTSRDTGWDEALFFYLPVSLAGGPLWWIAVVVNHLAERFERR